MHSVLCAQCTSTAIPLRAKTISEELETHVLFYCIVQCTPTADTVQCTPKGNLSNTSTVFFCTVHTMCVRSTRDIVVGWRDK